MIAVCSKVAERGGKSIAQVSRQWGTLQSPSRSAQPGGRQPVNCPHQPWSQRKPSTAHRDLGICIYRRVPMCSGHSFRVPLGGHAAGTEIAPPRVNSETSSSPSRHLIACGLCQQRLKFLYKSAEVTVGRHRSHPTRQRVESKTGIEAAAAADEARTCQKTIK